MVSKASNSSSVLRTATCTTPFAGPLVGQFEQMARSLNSGDAFEITYLGKKKTTTGKQADAWSVKRIIVK